MDDKYELRRYVENTFGYHLHRNLEDLRAFYRFDVTCQGSVPIAIMAFLQRDTAESALRLAISMGGDSDTIGCMTTAIATACPPHSSDPSCQIPADVVARCRALLTPDLLDINDRFEAWINRPFE